MPEGFVGVHIGAGQHSEARTQLYLSICAEACRVGVEVLRQGGSALEAACSATMVLENAGETNAGFGSNLTESGTVEMDAGIMDGSSLLFGAVGKDPFECSASRTKRLYFNSCSVNTFPKPLYLYDQLLTSSSRKSGAYA